MLSPRACRAFLSTFVLIFLPAVCPGQEKPQLTVEQKREFLLSAEVIGSRLTGKGVTSPYRLTLSDGKTTHDASFQPINERRRYGGDDMDIADSYRYNIAAYELSRLIGLDNMLPVTVERTWRGKTGSLSWWLPVQMDEKTRAQKKLQPPDLEAWINSMSKITIFTELIFNAGRALENVLIGNDWELYLVDFTRAFRLNHYPTNPKYQVRCSRDLFEKLRALDPEEWRAKAGPYLTNPELEAVLKRRDRIVDHFEQLIVEKGEASVLF